MNRRKFITVAGTSILVARGGFYLYSDKDNFSRNEMNPPPKGAITFKANEKEILFLASLAPSGHNTQPWFVKYVAPYHWIVGNDKNKWLPGVDPTQRETILSIGAFLKNLEYAANNFGYLCHFNVLATANQDENIAEVKLLKSGPTSGVDVEEVKLRRTIRSNFMSEVFRKEDIDYLIGDEANSIHFIPNTAKEHRWLNEQTIEANRVQSYREAAQEELATWIRFSSKDAERHCDGLTTASMEIEGVPGWVLRNFYDKTDVMKKSFREQSINKVKKQVSESAGWIIITNKNESVATLLDTGRQLQKLLLKVRRKNIAIHPMTQILEEPSISRNLNAVIGINDNVQFILRAGYVKSYPQPVSLRRPVDWFVRT